jgi:NADH-quinone oxidoreductase subunit I
MSNPLIEIYSGVKSLFVGMRITLGQFFKPQVTVHYPHETLKIPKRFRGHIELVRDPATGKAKCFVCKLCEKACPSDCITVEGMKPEGAKRKTVTYYRLDFTKCSLCGSCVEACRDSAIRFSREYNLAGTSKEDFVMDLFKRLEAEAALSPQSSSPGVQVPAEPAVAAKQPAAAKAELPKPVQPESVSPPTAPKVDESKAETIKPVQIASHLAMPTGPTVEVK